MSQYYQLKYLSEGTTFKIDGHQIVFKKKMNNYRKIHKVTEEHDIPQHCGKKLDIEYCQCVIELTGEKIAFPVRMAVLPVYQNHNKLEEFGSKKSNKYKENENKATQINIQF